MLDDKEKALYLLKLSERQQFIIADQMELYGGSFVKGLGNLYYKADVSNRKILIIAFAKYFWDYWERYAASNSTITG